MEAFLFVVFILYMTINLFMFIHFGYRFAASDNEFMAILSPTYDMATEMADRENINLVGKLLAFVALTILCIPALLVWHALVLIISIIAGIYLAYLALFIKK